MSPYREPAPHTCRFDETGWQPGTNHVFRRCECGKRETFGSMIARGIARATCVVSSHRWKRLRTNERRHQNLVHLHQMAGLLCVCERCGYKWDDTADWTSPAQ